jgi:DNA-binding response OmpR family regulator
MTIRILIIDDDDRTRKLFRKILEREKYEVTEACDGKEGIKLFRNEPADLVITDIIMPEKEGIETIMDLRKEYPEVKIIAISGGGRVEAGSYLEVAKKIGAAQTLAKPFTPDELLEAITNVLDKK